MAVKTNKLKGVIPAIITPLDDEGALDLGLLEKQAAYLSSAGVHGFFVGGTTAEGAYLTSEEKAEAFRVVRGVSKGRQFLCTACIRPSTPEVLDEMRALARLEPDFVVAVTPYYMAVRQQDILEHYRVIAREAPAPLILYNIPSNTHNPIALETVLELAGEKNIAGVKDSTGEFMAFSRGVVGDHPEGFVWIQGEDLLDGPSLLVGCDGIVTGLSNARVWPYVEIWRAAQAGDWQAVRAGQARINRLHAIIRYCGNSVAAVKAAAELAGRGSRWLRQRSLSLTDQQVEHIGGMLREFDAREGRDG
jgi:4-hydroxy-tetrahydrodipicolinate synthase